MSVKKYFLPKSKTLFLQHLPACVISRENGKLVAKSGLEIELLEMLKRKYNFSTNFIDGMQEWGVIINGSWTGIINQILNKVSL